MAVGTTRTDGGGDAAECPCTSTASLLGCRRMLLVCTELRFAHPVSGMPLTVVAPLSGEFLRLVERLQWAATLPPAWLRTVAFTADG